MKNNLNLTILLILILALNYSCTDPSVPVINFEEIDIEEEIGAEDPKGALWFKGKGAKMWKKALKNCMASDLLKKRSVNYLGTSNRLSIGDITDKRLRTTKRLFENLELKTDQIDKVIRKGIPSTCKETLNEELDISALLNADIKTGVNEIDAELSLVIDREKKSEFEVAEWRMNDLVINDFIDILRKNEKYSPYLEDMKKSKNRIMNREIVIKGFRATIKIDSKISTNLSDSLKNGISAKLFNQHGKIDLKLNTKNELELTSKEDFIVFGKFSKIKD